MQPALPGKARCQDSHREISCGRNWTRKAGTSASSRQSVEAAMAPAGISSQEGCKELMPGRERRVLY